MTYTAREMVVLGTLEMCRDFMHHALDGNEDIKLSDFIKVFAERCRNIELLMQQAHQAAKEEPKP